MRGSVRRFHAVRTPQWKYVERDTGSQELYDMIGDPDELENLAGSPEHTQTQADLDILLDQYAYCVGTGCW